MNLVYQAAVSVMNVTAPNTHANSSSQIWGTLIFQLLGNKLAMCLKRVFFSSEIRIIRLVNDRGICHCSLTSK